MGSAHSHPRISRRSRSPDPQVHQQQNNHHLHHHHHHHGQASLRGDNKRLSKSSSSSSFTSNASSLSSHTSSTPSSSSSSTSHVDTCPCVSADADCRVCRQLPAGGPTPATPNNSSATPAATTRAITKATAAVPCTCSCSSNNNNKETTNVNFSHNLIRDVPLPISEFKVVRLKAAIDKKPTSLDEKSPAVLKYRTPHFRAVAVVEVPPLLDKQSIQVGWIQVCTQMQFVNTYGSEGVTSWEFPEISSGRYQMVSDADGKQYPWYGSRHEIQTVSGPTTLRQTETVHMNDNFFPQVTWYIPHNGFERKPRLTYIYRKQQFYTMLVVKDLKREKYHVLKVIKWTMELNVEVNPENPPGKRAKLLGPFEQRPPVVLDDNNQVKLEDYALRPPNANNSQTLIWRPLKGDCKVIVPPVETTVDLDKYLAATKNMVQSLAKHAPEV